MNEIFKGIIILLCRFSRKMSSGGGGFFCILRSGFCVNKHEDGFFCWTHLKNSYRDSVNERIYSRMNENKRKGYVYGI